MAERSSTMPYAIKRQCDGFTVIEVNAAYTSQIGVRCGDVDAKNRKTRDLFICKCCHHSAHADVNAAKNCRDRRSDSELASVYIPRKALMDKILLKWWNTLIERNQNEQESCLDRWAGDGMLVQYCTEWVVEKSPRAIRILFYNL